MAHSQPVQLTIIGCGGNARLHIGRWLKHTDTTRVVVVCEPSPVAYDAVVALFLEAGQTPPPNEPDLNTLLSKHADYLDVAFISTPHVFHHDQTVACMEAGIDVLLEKPMVMNTAEARSLIEVRNRTGKLLIVAFDGGLSPYIRTASDMIRAGEIGDVRSISAVVWQNWRVGSAGTWRQQPEIAGGGFMFDTGAHMLNTVADLAGEEFAEVSAWLDYCDRPVDVQAVIMGRLRSGALVTMNGAGDTGVVGCDSHVRIFGTKGILHTGIWGEFLEIMREDEAVFTPVPVPRPQSTWHHFLLVRKGEMENPSPPEIGLRMARLWDAIKASADQNGAPVQLQPLVTQKEQHT